MGEEPDRQLSERELSRTKTSSSDDLDFNLLKKKNYNERSFEEEIGETHSDENEATRFSVQSTNDRHGSNLIKNSKAYVSKSESSSALAAAAKLKFENVLSHRHADLGIDKVHAHKVIHKIDMMEDEFGSIVGLRNQNNIEPATSAPCIQREDDGLFACLPDVYWIGASKSGTTSIAQYLHYHPMIRNMVGEARASTTHSKEGHFWEVSEHLFANSQEMIESRMKSMHKSQDGLTTLKQRPVMIEYTPNYFTLDHVPKLISEGFSKGKNKYKMKFIVSLREPVSRTLSSWRFKALEHYQMQERRAIRTGKPIEILLLNDSIHWGEMRVKCISDCYRKMGNSMAACSINKCRKMYDRFSMETKILSKTADSSTMCCRTSYYAHVVKSLYAYQFAKWFQFFDKSQFFIYTLEEFSRNRLGVLERLLDFLGLPLFDPSGKYGFKDRKTLTDLLALQINKTPRKLCFEEQITPAAEKYLHDFFAPHNALLEDVIGFNPYNETEYKGDVSHPEGRWDPHLMLALQNEAESINGVLANDIGTTSTRDNAFSQ